MRRSEWDQYMTGGLTRGQLENMAFGTPPAIADLPAKGLPCFRIVKKINVAQFKNGKVRYRFLFARGGQGRFSIHQAPGHEYAIRNRNYDNEIRFPIRLMSFLLLRIILLLYQILVLPTLSGLTVMKRLE